MSAADDIRAKAALFGWGTHTDHRGNDILIHGDKYVSIEYRKDGGVQAAEMYSFLKVEGVHTQLDRALGGHKRETVVSWLAEAA